MAHDPLGNRYESPFATPTTPIQDGNPSQTAELVSPFPPRITSMRKRILIGLLPLFVLLLVIGIYAVSLFTKLGGAIDVILRENYVSIVAAQNMKEAAERMDSALFFTLAGQEEMGRKICTQDNLPGFLTPICASKTATSPFPARVTWPQSHSPPSTRNTRRGPRSILPLPT